MWKPLSVISGLLLLGSSYVSHVFNGELTQEHKLQREAEDNLKAVNAHKALCVSTKLKYESDLNSALNAQKAMKDTLDGSKATRDTNQTTLAASKTKLDDVKKQQTEWKQKIDDLGGLEVIKAELTSLATKKVESEAKITERKATVALNLQKKQDQETALTALKKKTQMQAQGLLADTFRGNISNVDPQWGFITINKGNSANVVRNAKLDVQRGAQKIATIIVRNVQPSSAVCDILTGTLSAGEQVMAGDVVVVNSESSEKNLAASTTPVGATAPAAAGAGAATPAAAPAADPFGGAAPAAPAAAAAADPFASTPAATPPVEAAAPAAPAAPAADPFAPATPTP